jgi:hypothetical protein
MGGGIDDAVEVVLRPMYVHDRLIEDADQGRGPRMRKGFLA